MKHLNCHFLPLVLFVKYHSRLLSFWIILFVIYSGKSNVFGWHSDWSVNTSCVTHLNVEQVLKAILWNCQLKERFKFNWIQLWFASSSKIHSIWDARASTSCMCVSHPIFFWGCSWCTLTGCLKYVFSCALGERIENTSISSMSPDALGWPNIFQIYPTFCHIWPLKHSLDNFFQKHISPYNISDTLIRYT